MIQMKFRSHGKIDFLQLLRVVGNSLSNETHSWILPQLKKRMHKRDNLKRRAMISNDVNDWADFKKIRNQVNSKIKNAIEMYFKSAFYDSKGNSCKTWQIINELTCKKSSNLSVKEVRSMAMANLQQLSEAFNEYFSTIGPTFWRG